MERRAFVTVLTAGALAAATGALAQGGPPPKSDARPRWGAQAEKDFRLGRGLGHQLMTEEEWKAHQEKMRAMAPEEREKYRQEVHQQMMERAKEKGITMPPAPRGPARRPAS